MSDENKTENPYQPPALSDETLVKKDAAKTKAKLNPVHWLVPTLGYAYVPAFHIFELLYGDARSLGQDGIAEMITSIVEFLWFGIFISLPVYVVIILYLGWRRHRQGTNTTGMNLYHGLSLILPTWWFLRVLEVFLRQL
ncbi:MAG: hypothetical protein ACON32_03790 [Pirellulaceae bacterium]